MTDTPDAPPASPAIPSGQMAWCTAPTGWIAAAHFPRSGVGFRPSGELLIAGGGECFAAKLTPEDALLLAAILAAWADERAETAAAAIAAADHRMGAAGNA